MKILKQLRCPICGDSQYNPDKKSGYVIRTDNGSIVYKCHQTIIPCPANNVIPIHKIKNYTDSYQEIIA